jgi:transposase
MSNIVIDLLEAGLSEDEIAKRLGMEPEEVIRLKMRGDSIARKAKAEFNKGWVPGDK